MAQSGDSGATMYAGLAIVLLIALAALALFKFNLFHVADMLGNTDEGHTTIRRATADDGGEGNTSAHPAQDEHWDTPPNASKYTVKHNKPLPQTITFHKNVAGETVEIEMCLVPQGWFQMGENDGVRSNSPKRWIWLDDYYIAKTEMTNSQFYGFILADGYRKTVYWTQEGFDYMKNQVRFRGTTYVGWLPLERTNRLWGLASPRSNDTETLTLEVLDDDGLLGVNDCTVLVLPQNGAWENYLSIDDAGSVVNVRMKYRGEWKDIDGLDIRGDKDHMLTEAGFRYFTNDQGRVDLSDIKSSTYYTVVAWAHGDKSHPTLGKLRRSASPYMRDGNMPVVELSWFEADACARFFSGALPTEAQWEKAGRGVDGKLFPWGDDLEMTAEIPTGGTKHHSTLRANLNRWRVMPVGSFPEGASVYGVEDLVGNVSEWCRDVYIENPKWEEKNPLSRGGAQDRRSERGSSTHDDDPQTAKLHNRRYSDPYSRGIDTRGFRIVLDPETALKMAK